MFWALKYLLINIGKIGLVVGVLILYRQQLHLLFRATLLLFLRCIIHRFIIKCIVIFRLLHRSRCGLFCPRSRHRGQVIQCILLIVILENLNGIDFRLLISLILGSVFVMAVNLTEQYLLVLDIGLKLIFEIRISFNIMLAHFARVWNLFANAVALTNHTVQRVLSLFLYIIASLRRQIFRRWRHWRNRNLRIFQIFALLFLRQIVYQLNITANFLPLFGLGGWIDIQILFLLLRRLLSYLHRILVNMLHKRLFLIVFVDWLILRWILNNHLFGFYYIGLNILILIHVIHIVYLDLSGLFLKVNTAKRWFLFINIHQVISFYEDLFLIMVGTFFRVHAHISNFVQLRALIRNAWGWCSIFGWASAPHLFNFFES